uniref:Polyprotein n=1 Tax=Grapevine chrome mosaic virus TaxID=12273 RepID=A0A0E4C0F2_GCMV|nr:polyprotein [Grapevine chrome mosaic virus]
MGFSELFSSALGTVARAKATLQGGFARFLSETAATLQAASPEMRKLAYSKLWEEVDSVKELKPLTASELVATLRKELWCSQVHSQKCTPASTSRFCSCGGIPGEATPTVLKETVQVDECPTGRNLCRNSTRCLRHGGPGSFQQEREVLVEAPKCPHCAGTGIIPASAPWREIRRCWRAQRKTHALPSLPLHPDVLFEGTNAWSTRVRWLKTWRHVLGDVKPCSPEKWMQAAQIMRTCAVPSFENPIPGQFGYERLYNGEGKEEYWLQIPATDKYTDLIINWWHAKNTPDWEEPSSSLQDFKRNRMGPCLHEVEKRVRSSYVAPPWKSWGEDIDILSVMDSLSSQLEDFLDVFYDCASQFDGELEFALSDDRLSSVSGKLGGVPISIGAPSTILSTPPKVDFAELYGSLIRQNQAKINALRPIMMAHPDQEETEDQLDHLENKQGGEIVSTPSFIKMLKDKRKEVRGKEFEGGSEGRLVRSSDLELSKKDIFLAHTLMDKFHGMSIVKKFGKSDPKLTKVCVDLTNQEEVVKFPTRELQTTSEGVLSAQTFTVLNRPQFKELNRLAEVGWKEAKSVCLNLHIRSYLPVHLPVYAFCVIMWGHSSNAEQASLSGAYIYLGDQEASVLQLPLLCGYIGSALEDMEAYKRSLVLSTCFFGTSGLSPGQNMFGITAVEFTEYLPTSYGGITHKRDSWNQMLRNHQGADKQRFISGFNVVDFVEAGKEKQLQFPDFDLQPVPKHQPIVRTFGEEKQPLLNKSRSMRVKTFASFRAGNIPIGRQVDNTAEAINFELGRASTSNAIHSRLDTSETNLRAGGEFAFIHTIDLPTAVTEGQVLAKIDIFQKIQDAKSMVCVQWMQAGYVNRNLTFISHLAPSQFCGVALWYIFDAYGKIPSDVTTSLELEIARSLCPHVHVLRDPKTSVWTIDFHKICGQSLNFSGRGFSKPTLWVIAASTAQLPWSAQVTYRLEALAQGDEIAHGLATRSIVTYPISLDHLKDIEIMLPPRQMAIGNAGSINFPLSFAVQQKSSSGRIAYSYAAGLLSHFLGIGGTIHFKIQCTSSAFVTARLRVALWGDTITLEQLSQMPHVDCDVGIVSSLKIQSPFFATANFGDSGARFWVTPMSSPMAPETMESKLEYYIQILGIDADPPMCRQINYDQRFAWFTLLRPSDPKLSKILKLTLPSRVCNIAYKEATVTNYVNAFAIMCATTGMHAGKCILHFSWTLNKGTSFKDLQGHISFYSGMGDSTIGEHHGEFHLGGPLSSSLAVPFEFGSFAGPVTSGGTPFASENWLRVETAHWDWLTSLTVDIQVLPGFRFYGRSAGPLTIPS